MEPLISGVTSNCMIFTAWLHSLHRNFTHGPGLITTVSLRRRKICCILTFHFVGL